MLMERSLMMEEKQLDFNRPLLSVRRPVTQSSESENRTRSSDSVVTNKIPPSSPSPPVYKSDIKSGPVRNPGTVPFQWEHKPGKPKAEKNGLLEPHVVPKLPPGREGRKLEVNVVTKNVPSLDERSFSSDDDDGTYLEATDTLSRSESFFFNCSNVSGLDGLVEPFGSLSSDRQTQDLMMGRFLPAAKALTSETPPPQLSRKPPKPEEAKKVVQVKEKQRKTEQNPYRFRHSPDQEEANGSMGFGVCGLVPHICLRSSLGILNPVPSVGMQAQRAVSVRSTRSKYQDSCNEKQNKETDEDKRKLKPVAQGPSRAKVSKKFGELLARDDNKWPEEAPVAEKTLYIDIVHSVDKKVQQEFKKQSLSNESPSLDVLDPVEDSPKLIGAGEEAILEAKVAQRGSKSADLEVKLDLESSRIHHHIVAPPPLPKAPSDSWLKRTLPTIPPKNNSFAWLQSESDVNHHFTKIQASPNWETMVKTSNTPFSKEVLNPIPEA